MSHRQFKLTEARQFHRDHGHPWTFRSIVVGCALDDEQIERVLRLQVGEKVELGDIHITRLKDAEPFKDKS